MFFSRAPHVGYVVKRAIQPQHHSYLERVFNFVIANGGEEEVDFSRTVGASFNPRPGRIAIILMGDGQVHDPLMVASGMLASLSPYIIKTLASELYAYDVIARALNACSSVEEIVALAEPERTKVSLIALAHRLDRARHLHLANQTDRLPLWNTFHAETTPYLKLAKEMNANLYTLLSAWYERFQSRLEVQPLTALAR